MAVGRLSGDSVFGGFALVQDDGHDVVVLGEGQVHLGEEGDGGVAAEGAGRDVDAHPLERHGFRVGAAMEVGVS